MKQSSKVLLWLALLLGLAAAGLVALLQPAPPDQTQITQQLETARAAGERHDIGGLMTIISEKYHDSNFTSPTQLRFFLGKVQGSEPTQITQSIPVISLQGDTATSTSHLRIVTTANNQVVFDRDITLRWQREDGARFGIIPAKVWRVVGADYGAAPGD